MSYPPIIARTPEDRNWWFAARTHALLGILDREVERAGLRATAPPGQRDMLVLDVGCGAGNMHHHLLRYGQVRGIDTFNRPLRIAQQRGQSVSQCEGTALAFPDSSFELVTALDVIEHCKDDGAVLAECARVLKPGGLLAVTVPAFPWLWSDNDTLNGHLRRYTPAELTARLRDSDLGVQKVTCNNLAVLPMAAGLIFLRRLRGQKLALSTPATDEDAYQVEMQSVHPALNTVLTALGLAEARLLGHVSFPAGTGLIAVAQKPGGCQQPGAVMPAGSARTSS